MWTIFTYAAKVTDATKVTHGSWNNDNYWKIYYFWGQHTFVLTYIWEQ